MRRLFLLGTCFVFLIISNAFGAAAQCSLTPLKSDSDASFCTAFAGTPGATYPNDVGVVKCQCYQVAGPVLGPVECNTMDNIYTNMVNMYGSVENGCSAAVINKWATSQQACIDQWNCYRNGGKDSEGNLCNTTGKMCPAT